MKKDHASRINKELSTLVSQPMRFIYRFLDMICLEFGETIEKSSMHYENGETSAVNEYAGEFALHVQTSFRLTTRSSIIFTSNDMFQPSNKASRYDDGDLEKLDLGIKGNNRLDEMLDEFFVDLNGFIVKNARVNALGDLYIQFENKLVFQAMTDVTESIECWRLFRHNYNSEHLVVGSTGILPDD